jgi:hypothetical protein
MDVNNSKNIERYKGNSVITYNSFRYDVDKKLFNFQEFGSIFPRKFDKSKLSFILNIILQHSLQDTDIDVMPHITVRCH